MPAACPTPPALTRLEQQALYAMHHFRVLTRRQNQVLAALIPDIECAWWECTVERPTLDWGDDDESDASGHDNAAEDQTRALHIRQYVQQRIREGRRLGSKPTENSREWLLIWLYGVPVHRPTGLRDPITLRPRT